MEKRSSLLDRLDGKAFTLIELLVVVLIIGILAAVALPQYQKAVLRSRYATLKTMTRSLGDSQERYYLANGTYTTNIDEMDIDFFYKYCFEGKQKEGIWVFKIDYDMPKEQQIKRL